MKQKSKQKTPKVYMEAREQTSFRIIAETISQKGSEY